MVYSKEWDHYVLSLYCAGIILSYWEFTLVWDENRLNIVVTTKLAYEVISREWIEGIPPW